MCLSTVCFRPVHACRCHHFQPVAVAFVYRDGLFGDGTQQVSAVHPCRLERREMQFATRFLHEILSRRDILPVAGDKQILPSVCRDMELQGAGHRLSLPCRLDYLVGHTDMDTAEPGTDAALRRGLTDDLHRVGCFFLQRQFQFVGGTGGETVPQRVQHE